MPCWLPAWRSGTSTSWTRSRCRAACSRTCYSPPPSCTCSGRRASPCSPTARCRATTAGSASVRPWWPGPATGSGSSTGRTRGSVARRRNAAAQPVIPGLDAIAGGGRDLQQQRLRRRHPQIRHVLLDVEVHVREQVGLVQQDEVGLAEHVRVLQRLVGALGDGGQYDAGFLAEVEQSRADKVADVLDDDNRAARRGR